MPSKRLMPCTPCHREATMIRLHVASHHNVVSRHEPDSSSAHAVWPYTLSYSSRCNYHGTKPHPLYNSIPRSFDNGPAPIISPPSLSLSPSRHTHTHTPFSPFLSLLLCYPLGPPDQIWCILLAVYMCFAVGCFFNRYQLLVTKRTLPGGMDQYHARRFGDLDSVAHASSRVIHVGSRRHLGAIHQISERKGWRGTMGQRSPKGLAP